MKNEPNNRSRSLGQIAVVNAWFDLIPDKSPPRYSFHMDVSFREERLGGEPGDPVRFRVGLLQCEVAVVLPAGEAKLVIDPRSIASDQSTATVRRNREHATAKSASGAIRGRFGSSGGSAGASGAVSGNTSTTNTTVIQDETALLLGQRSKTGGGDLSWIVSRADGQGILDQVIWDARAQPRFDLIDKRDSAQRDRDARNQLHPTVRVEVHCRSEDLQITDISLTDPDERRGTAIFKNPQKRQKAAEAFIKRELLSEGLRAVNIHDPFGRLIVGDMIVSLVDDA